MSNGFDEYVVHARQLAENGQIDEAVETYRVALEEDPTNEEVRRDIINLTLKREDFQQTIVEYFDWAEACQVQGAIDDAIRIYQEIIGLPTLLQKKIFMMDQRVANEAIAQIQETIQAANGAIFFNLGYLYLEKGALDESISCLQKSLEFNPGDAKTHTLLGQVYMQKGQDNEATGEFQEVVRLAPDEAAYAYEMLGEIFIRKGKPPQSSITWFKNAGDLYLRHEQFEEAIRAYERILSFEPGNKSVLEKLGEIYFKQGWKEQALDIYKQLAEIYGKEGLLDRVIIIYEKLSEWDPENIEVRDKVIEIYRRIVKMDPSNLNARHKLIGNLLRKGSAQEAIPEFIGLSETYLSKGMKKEAFSVCRKLLELDPREARAHELIADIFYGQGKKEEALKEYLLVIKLCRDKGDDDSAARINEKLLEMFPGTKEVSMQMAISHKQRGDFDAALIEFAKILRDEPANVNVLQNMMDIYEVKNELDKVIEFAYKIVNIDNTRTDMQDKIISIYQRQGNTQKIIEIYRYMLKADPSRVELRQKILEIYEQEEKHDKVIEMYREILDAEPDRTDIRQKIIQNYASEGRIDDVLRESSVLADIFLKNDEVEKAESLYKNVLAFMPDDMRIRENICSIYEKKGESDKVQEELLVLANISYNSGNYETSLRNCQKMLEFTPNDVNLKMRIAKMAVSLNNAAEAVVQYRDVTEVYLDKKMTEPALRTIGNILEIDNENIEYRNKLIEILKNQLKTDEATTHYKILISHFIKRNQSDDAINAARDAIAMQPLDLDLRKEIVELFIQGGDTENGGQFARELIDIYLSRGDYDEVIGIYDRLSHIQKEKGNIPLYYEMRENIAEIYERQSRYSNAVEEFVNILEGNLFDSRIDQVRRIFPILTELYYKEEKPGEAIETYKNLTGKLYKFGKIGEALLTLEQVEEIQEKSELWDNALESLLQMIDYYKEQGDSAKIIETHRRRIDIYHRIKSVDLAVDEMFAIIRHHLNNSDMESALEQFKEVENFEPDDTMVMFRMAEMLFEFGLFEQSKQLYENVLEREPENFDVVARLAIIYAKAGNLQDAVVYTKKIFSKGLVAEVIEEYKKSSEIDPDDAQIHINMGLFYQEMGFIEEAIAEFQMAAMDKERLLEAYRLLALCFKQESFIDLAVKQLERALEQKGYPEEDYLPIRYSLGEILLESGKEQEALSAFYECYMVDINYRDISVKISQLSEKLSSEDEE
ncbi:MAG: tetratricopeptide repeat protein [Firmicutes bacterium]|nr:tetratricopeptide repeat protein [Bacillota bacterium]